LVLDGSDGIDGIDVSGGLGNLHVDRGDEGETIGQRWSDEICRTTG
jgi:hypothetical protein